MTQKRVLIVLDINGTLLDRIKGVEYKSARKNPACPDSHDTTINKHKVFLRPYLDHFLEELFSRYAVAAWTSAEPKNANALFTYVFGLNTHRLRFAYNRTHCIVDERRQSYKLLDTFWKSETNMSREWSARNTILVDDSAYKATHNTGNLLLIPSYCVGEKNCRQDTALVSVIDYLDQMIESESKKMIYSLNYKEQIDVVEYMSKNKLFVPVSNDKPTTSITATSSITQPSSQTIAASSLLSKIELIKDDDESEAPQLVDDSLRVVDAHYFSSICKTVPKWRHEMDGRW